MDECKCELCEALHHAIATHATDRGQVLACLTTTLHDFLEPGDFGGLIRALSWSFANLNETRARKR